MTVVVSCYVTSIFCALEVESTLEDNDCFFRKSLSLLMHSGGKTLSFVQLYSSDAYSSQRVFNSKPTVTGVRHSARDTRLLFRECACPLSENSVVTCKHVSCSTFVGGWDRVLLRVTSCNSEVGMTGYCSGLHHVTEWCGYDRVLFWVTSCNVVRWVCQGTFLSYIM